MEIEEIKEKLFSKNAKILGPLVGGMMNQSFIVQDGEEKYVMYISTEQANEMVDRVLEKKHMLLANSLGISNECKGFIVEKGIKATKYIEGSSIDKVNEFDYEKVAELLRKLHSSETLSPQDYLPFERFKGYESEANEFISNIKNQYKDASHNVYAYYLKKNKQDLK